MSTKESSPFSIVSVTEEFLSTQIFSSTDCRLHGPPSSRWLDKGLSVSIVKEYHSALNQVVIHKGMDLSTSRDISRLIKSFVKSCSPQKVRPLEWDISFVLHTIMKLLTNPQ